MQVIPLTPERRRQQTRECLLQAAAGVFAERGFHGASLDEVAANAGFTKGAVYSNFKNKEDLFLALLEYHQSREMEALRAMLESSEVPPEARLSDLVALIRRQVNEIGDVAALYHEFFVYALRNPEARRKLAEFDAFVVASVSALIEGERRRWGIAGAEPVEHVARMVVALFRGIDLMRLMDGDKVDDAFLQSVMSVVARGVVPEQVQGSREPQDGAV